MKSEKKVIVKEEKKYKKHVIMLVETICKILDMDHKLKRYIVFISITSTVMAILLMIFKGTETPIEDGVIPRPKYDQAAQKFDINAYREGENFPIVTNIEIQPQKYSVQEINNVFDEVYDRALVIIKGDNASLDEVSTKLNLIKEIPGYAGTIGWYSTDYDLIDYDGTVKNDNFKEQEKRTAELTMEFEYGEYRCERNISVTVVSKSLSQEALAARNIQEEILQADQSSVKEKGIQLPDQVDGRRITYTYRNESTSPFVAIGIGLLAITGVILGAKRDKEKQKKKQLEQLKCSYPEVISKLTLLVGAGMTVRRAWEKIVMDYQLQKEKAKRGEEQQSKILVYEKMTEAYNQMKAGVPEVAVYEMFGSKCDTKEYLKMCALLEQNIKKGTKDLIVLLEHETYSAFEERKNMAKKQGEEAGTRLLVPMIMMLAIVMVIIMVPAVMSFQI